MLCIEQHILKKIKTRRKNVVMAMIDYKCYIAINISILTVIQTHRLIQMHIQLHKHNTGGLSVVQVRTHLLTSGFGSSTRGERQFLKVFCNHTMLTTSQRSAHLVVQSQFLNTMVLAQFLTSLSDPNFSTL